MPIMKMKEIRGMPPEEKARRIVELKTELARQRTMVEAGGALENPSRIREIRKTIARILTVINEKKEYEK